MIFASDDNEVTTSQAPVSTPAVGGPGPRDIHGSGQRYDRGPEDSSHGIRESDAAAPVYVNPSTGYPTTRYEAGPGEAPAGASARARRWSPL